ncbi:MAG: LptA/OstA family protein, partial [Armatimonadota bacterium]|nr:LptA/OstA family protein [Armatimonadota bacterium]
MTKLSKQCLAFGIISATLMAKVVTSLIAAQQGNTTAKPAEPTYKEVKYSADSSSFRWDGEDRIAVLKGNVRFVHGDTTLQADKVDYSEKTKTATATGNLKIYDERNTITADLCVINFEEKKGTLTGNVRMVAKPKPKKDTGEQKDSPKSLSSEWKDEAVITCDKIDYYYKLKKAVVANGLKIVQKNRIVTADSATYFGKEDKVELVGNIKGYDEKEKHSFSAPRVVISLKENDEW